MQAALERLAPAWEGYWPGTDPKALAADIAERLAAATAAWGLEDLRPLDGGVVALTCAAERSSGPVVLKLNPRGHPEDAQLAGEGEALDFWRPTGAAVELLDRRDDGFTLLMERARPGHTLDDTQPDPEERLAELGRLAARLHSAGPPPDGFMHIDDFITVLEPEPARGEEVLVHLDLHGGNALRAGDGWKAIDPKGVRADRHADVWALIDPMMLDHLPVGARTAQATARRWVSVYAEAAAMEPELVRAWTLRRAEAEVREGSATAALDRMAAALASD